MATLLLVLPFYLLFSLPQNTGSRKATWLLTKHWSRIWLWLTGMKVHTYGRVPGPGKFVIIANHVSYLDPIVIYDVIPFYFRPLAKHEIAKAPLFGFIYGQIALLVDRSSIAKRGKSMLQMRQTLLEECSIFMYPEGTFNETGEPMKPFHDGAFRLAIDTGVPLLPVIFPDTKARWHYEAWWKMWPGRNRAYVLEAVSTEGLTLQQLPALREEVRALMSAAMRSCTS